MICKQAITIPLLIAGICFTSAAWSHPASRVMATTSARVIEDLTIISECPLNFGYVIPSQKGGTVTVSANNKRTETGGVHASSSFERATFAVRGTPGHSYTIHTPSSLAFTVKGHRYEDEWEEKEEREKHESKHLIDRLTVRDFTTYSTNTGKVADTGKLNQRGQDRIYLGATLEVPPGTAPGVYSGWVPLTVSY